MAEVVHHQETGVPIYQGKSLLFPIKPAPGETLLGYIARVVDQNYLGSVRSFLALGGINFSIKGDYLTKLSSSLPILSELLGLPTSELQQLWGAEPLTADGKRRLGGVYLRPHQICQHTRRLPRSSAIPSHDRAIWMLDHLDFCPVSWDRLIDVCPICHQTLTWPQARALHTCGRCGGTVAHTQNKRVPLKDREILSLVVDLFSDDELTVTRAVNQVPTFFEIESATDVYELVLAFAQAAYGERYENFTRKGRWGYEYLVVGARMVFEYPRSVWDLYRRLVRNKQPSLLKTAVRIARDHSQPVVAHNIERLMAVHRRPELDRPSTSSNFIHDPINLSHAGRLLSTTRSKVMDLVTEGHLPPVDQPKGVLFTKVHRQDVNALRSKLDGWFDKDKLKAQLCLPEVAIEQLLSTGWLSPDAEPVARLVKGDRALAPETANELLHNLMALPSTQQGDGYISLSAAFRGIGGREKPWAPVITAALRGKFPGGLKLLSTERHACLAVHEATARAILMGGPNAPSPYAYNHHEYGKFGRDWLTPSETESYLNCTAQDVIWLKNRGHLIKLDHEKPRYCRLSVREVGLTFMTTREAAARLGIRPQDIWMLTEACDHATSIGQGFHHRELLEALVQAEAPKACWWN